MSSDTRFPILGQGPVYPIDRQEDPTCCNNIGRTAIIAGGLFLANVPVSALVAWAWPTACITVLAASFTINSLCIICIVAVVAFIEIQNALLDKTRVSDNIKMLTRLFGIFVFTTAVTTGTFVLISVALAAPMVPVLLYISKILLCWFLLLIVVPKIYEGFQKCRGG